MKTGVVDVEMNTYRLLAYTRRSQKIAESEESEGFVVVFALFAYSIPLLQI